MPLRDLSVSVNAMYGYYFYCLTNTVNYLRLVTTIQGRKSQILHVKSSILLVEMKIRIAQVSREKGPS